ncbi:MAG: hypothetical protein GW778_01520 [Alphaproteobacteria bacterium]|nr:hypothetical protein [Alphaproteobacteria bacterium]
MGFQPDEAQTTGGILHTAPNTQKRVQQHSQGEKASTTQNPNPSITSLKASLEDTFVISGHDPAILNKQAELLDRLFTAIIDEQVAPKIAIRTYDASVAQGWLAFALKIQKQCNDTLKSRAAIDYMHDLSNRITPLPHYIEKQKEGS